MGIYFRDILLIRISRGANNCGQHSLEKNIYFIMRFSPHSQLFYFNDRLEFCEFIEWKIKRINNADLFSQPPFLTFIKGANISGGHCNNTVKQFNFFFKAPRFRHALRQALTPTPRVNAAWARARAHTHTHVTHRMRVCTQITWTWLCTRGKKTI